MCVKCVSNLAEKSNSGSASIPHSPPATLYCCRDHHPPHHWSKMIQLAIHQQVCLRALDQAAFSNLSVHCLAVEPHHVHPEPHLLLLPLMTILSVPHKRILLVLLWLCNCFTMLPSSSVPIARTLSPAGLSGIPRIPGSRDLRLMKIPGFLKMKSRDFSGFCAGQIH